MKTSSNMLNIFGKADLGSHFASNLPRIAMGRRFAKRTIQRAWTLRPTTVLLLASTSFFARHRFQKIARQGPWHHLQLSHKCATEIVRTVIVRTNTEFATGRHGYWEMKNECNGAQTWAWGWGVGEGKLVKWKPGLGWIWFCISSVLLWTHKLYIALKLIGVKMFWFSNLMVNPQSIENLLPNILYCRLEHQFVLYKRVYFWISEHTSISEFQIILAFEMGSVVRILTLFHDKCSATSLQYIIQHEKTLTSRKYVVEAVSKNIQYSPW